ncbi:MAG: Uma2 family endonuclease [Anaerolineae bacterium]
MEMTPELKRQIVESLPEWVEREPRLRRRLQAALQQSENAAPYFDTFAEFIEWVDEDVSAEWVKGAVVYTSPASTVHQLLCGFLQQIIGVFVQERHLGAVLAAPYKMKLPEYGPEPDLVFVSNENRTQLTDTFLDGPADLVIEIISPESVGRDRGDKFMAYETAAIPEYWLIDPIRQQAEFYLLDENGRYQLSRLDEDGRFHSQTIPGLWVKPDWFWADPLPSVVNILRQLEII